MHPLIRILCFLIFAAWLAWGDLRHLLFGAILLAPAYLLTSPASLLPAITMLRRLRWFFLSLLVIYGWFTPGHPLVAIAAVPALAPTQEGLMLGLLRCMALVLIVLAVNLLLRTTGRGELIGAIHGLAAPLAAVGLSRERLALRMALVLEAIDEVREIVVERAATRRRGRAGPAAAGEFAAALVADVLAAADRREPRPVTLPAAPPPAWAQWSLPLLLWTAFYLAGVTSGG